MPQPANTRCRDDEHYMPDSVTASCCSTPQTDGRAARDRVGMSSSLQRPPSNSIDRSVPFDPTVIDGRAVATGSALWLYQDEGKGRVLFLQNDDLRVYRRPPALI